MKVKHFFSKFYFKKGEITNPDMNWKRNYLACQKQLLLNDAPRSGKPVEVDKRSNINIALK